MIQTIFWEAHYIDGTHISEARGAKYSQIDRANLRTFLLRDNEGPLVELAAEEGRTGWNLVYRRRTTLIPGQGQSVVYMLGWVPMGPIIAVDSDNFQIYQASSFIPNDPMFYPPVQHAWEGERWGIEHPSMIVNPAAERT